MTSNNLSQNKPTNINLKFYNHDIIALDHEIFLHYKKLLENRLHRKQRIEFNFIVERGIHGGLDDIFCYQRALKRNGTIMNLHRKFFHRPHPIQIQSNPFAVIDLKLADCKYFKLYGTSYRAATPADVYTHHTLIHTYTYIHL